MKQRVISAMVGLVILLVVFLLFDTLVFNAVMALISIIAVLEMLKAVDCIKNKGLTGFAVLVALLLQFARVGYVRAHMPTIVLFLVFGFFVLLLISHNTVRIEKAAMTFFFSFFIPLFFGCAVYIREDFGFEVGAFYLLWALGSAWLCDTGAYFTGTKLGKHKLAPIISPNKTVEGVVGGMVTASVVMMLIAAAYARVMQVQINYIAVALLTLVFAAAGILGDLSASAIKRQFHVKDYGHIMPGHGGVLDRFDSVLFTLPCVYTVVQYVTVAVLVA